MGSWRVGHDWATSLSLFTFMHWRRKWKPTPVFLPGESQGPGSLVGCRLWGRRVGHDWSDLAATAAATAYHYLERLRCKSKCPSPAGPCIAYSPRETILPSWIQCLYPLCGIIHSVSNSTLLLQTLWGLSLYYGWKLGPSQGHLGSTWSGSTPCPLCPRCASFFLTLQCCIGFAIYQNESATGIHVFPTWTLLPPPLRYS